MSDVPIFYNLQTAGDVTAITGKLADLETTVKTNLVAAINELDGNFPVSVANGGTGQTSLTSGNILLGNGTSGIDSVDVLPIAKGGTGGSTATLARTNLDVMTGVQLYYNASGTHGSIVLSDSIANYSKIEIFFLFNEPNVCDSNSLWTGGASSIIASLTVGYSLQESSEPRIRFFNSVVTLSANTLTFGNESYCTLRPKNTTSTNGTVTVGDNATYATVAIYKIVGYKY